MSSFESMSATLKPEHWVRIGVYTANCIMIDHFSAFEPGLVAPFLYAA
jgi:hypothetical protein